MNSPDEKQRYSELKNKIINNKELSDQEWDEFYELLNKVVPEERKAKWDKLLFDSLIWDEEPAPAYQNKKDKIINFSKEKKKFPIRNFALGQYLAANYSYAFIIVLVISGIIMLHYNSNSTGDVNKISSSLTEKIQSKYSQSARKEFRMPDIDKNSGNQRNIAQSIDNSNLSENPYLEPYASDVARSANIKIYSPAPDTLFRKSLSGFTYINFNGSIKPEEYKKDYTLKIFDNQENSFKEDKFIFTAGIIRDLNEKDVKYNFNFKSKFDKGLYYYIIEETETENVLYVGRFFIK